VLDALGHDGGTGALRVGDEGRHHRLLVAVGWRSATSSGRWIAGRRRREPGVVELHDLTDVLFVSPCAPAGRPCQDSLALGTRAVEACGRQDSRPAPARRRSAR